jgi:hypothetical protein
MPHAAVHQQFAIDVVIQRRQFMRERANGHMDSTSQLLPAAVDRAGDLVEPTAFDGWDTAEACALLLLACPVPFHDPFLPPGALRPVISAKFYGAAVLGVYLFRGLLATEPSAELSAPPKFSEPQSEQFVNRRSSAAT